MASADPAPVLPITPSDPLTIPPSETPATSASGPPRALVLAALAILLIFIAAQGWALWREWGRLQGDMTVVRQSAVIGYPNIHPNPSYAIRPENWFHHEGPHTFLWAGWRHGEGHRWFRIPRDQVQKAQISLPMGRDVIQAIDYPIVENGGGVVWKRIPEDSPVIGVELGGVSNAYPLHVLSKVGVVNDLIGDRPFLVTFRPFVGPDRAIHIYEPVIEGRRITFGSAGYLKENKPVLYDRGSESLWIADDDGTLRALAGHHKGVALPHIGRPVPIAWSDWRRRFPRTRLVVGADRSRNLPSF